MSYSDAQLEATKAFIIDFFVSKSKSSDDLLEKFKGHIARVLKELKIFNPDSFTFCQTNKKDEYLITWISENILDFPEDFSVTLTSEGNSFGIIGGQTTIIYDTPPQIHEKKSFSTDASSADSNFSSNPMSKTSSSSDTPKSNSLSLYESQDKNIPEQPSFFYNEENVFTLKKILINSMSPEMNNAHCIGDNPKYVTGSAGAIYVPTYKKKLSGHAYSSFSQVQTYKNKITQNRNLDDIFSTPKLDPNNANFFFEADWMEALESQTKSSLSIK